MAKPLYQKYGVASPDFGSLVEGQKAVATSLKDAMSGVESLFNQQKKRIVDQNTTDMEVYLKDQIRSAGLGADPIDTTSLTQKFGDRLDMTRLDKTIAMESQSVQKDAVEMASQKAYQTLMDTNDEAQARQVLGNTLREMGGKESFISSTEQAWNDSHAVARDDAKLRKTQQDQELEYGFLESMRQPGANENLMLTAALANVQEKDRPATRDRLKKSLEDRRALSDEEIQNVDFFVSQRGAQGKQQVFDLTSQADELDRKLQVVKQNGVSDSSYKLVEKINSDLGGNVGLKIGDKVTNWLESWAGSSSDKGRVFAIRNRLINDLKIPGDKADAMIAQGFNNVFNEESWWGNDLNAEDIDAMEAQIGGMVTAHQKEMELSPQLTAARTRAAKAALRHEEDLINYRQELTDAAKANRLGVEGSVPVTDYVQNSIRSRQAALDAAPAPGQPQATNIPAEHQEIFKATEQKYAEQGVPSGFLSRLAMMESNGKADAKNPNSSAAGYFQFIDQTAKGYNIDPLDPAQAADAAGKYAGKNGYVLKKALGRTPTEGELYLAHQQDGPKAAELLKNPTKRAADIVGEKQVTLNGGSADMTAKEFSDLWIQKWDQKFSGSSEPAESAKSTNQKLIEQANLTFGKGAQTPDNAPALEAAVSHRLNQNPPNLPANAPQAQQDPNPYNRPLYNNSGDMANLLGTAVQRQQDLLSNANIPSRTNRVQELRKLSPKEREARLEKLSKTHGRAYAKLIREDLAND